METLDASEFILGIGCSAGGVEALKDIVGKLPTQKIGYVVVQHLSPNHESHMVEILRPLTKLKVREAVSGDVPGEGVLLLTPPGQKIFIKNSKIVLSKYEVNEERTPLHSIDVFFESLALDAKEQAAVLVMSGSGSDGARGCRAIKEQGGFVIAQEPGTAKFSSMPTAVVKGGLADVVADLNAIPTAVEDLLDISRTSRETVESLSVDNEIFEDIISLVSADSKIDFTRYKRGTLKRRVAKRLALTRSRSLAKYKEFLESDKTEREFLSNDFFIGVTSFFRDPDFFNVLKEKVIRDLASSSSSDEKIRVWVPACSTGEEAYSIAFLLQEIIGDLKSSVDFRIFGSDIDQRAIAKAQEAVYSPSALLDVPAPYKTTCFDELGDGNFRVKKKIRDKVVFSKHDLLGDPPFGKMDFVSFRNCSIYLVKAAQKETLLILEHSLKIGGYLFLGSSESPPDSQVMDAIDSKAKIFIKSKKRPSTQIFEIVKSRAERSRSYQVGEKIRTASVRDLNRQIESIILEEVVPATMVVSADGSLVHVAGDVNEYISFKNGATSGSIFEIIEDKLKNPIKLILRRLETAVNANEPISTTVPRFGKHTQGVRIEIRKRFVKGESDLFLVTFYPRNFEHSLDGGLRKDVDGTVDELMVELDQSRKDLNFTVENLESTNEELQSSNEELVTSNEELQSVNEELQSVNEELYTMNSEYQNKIDEISESRRDMDALLEVANIGTLFLDGSMAIRKISERVKNSMGFRDGDVGRNIEDFRNQIYKGFYSDCRLVIENRKPIEHQVKIKGEGWSLIKIHPYESFEGVKDGVVVMIIDISELKAMKQSQDLLFKFLLSSKEVSFGVDLNGKIDLWTDGAKKLFSMSEEEALGMHESIFIPLKAQKDLEIVRSQVDKGQPVYLSKTYRLDSNDKDFEATLIANGRYTSKGKLSGVRYTILHENQSSDRHKRLKKELETLRTLLESNPTPVIVLDEKGSIEYVNNAACDLLKLDKDEIYKMSYNDPSWKLSHLDGKPLEDSEIPFKKVIVERAVVRNNKIRIETGKDKFISICVSGAPIWNDDNLTGAIMSFYMIEN